MKKYRIIHKGIEMDTDSLVKALAPVIESPQELNNLLGRLGSALVNKGVLTLSEANNIFCPLYTVVENKDA